MKVPDIRHPAANSAPSLAGDKPSFLFGEALPQ
jgi:hypothetical protein